jgi:hypothetical protein
MARVMCEVQVLDRVVEAYVKRKDRCDCQQALLEYIHVSMLFTHVNSQICNLTLQFVSVRRERFIMLKRFWAKSVSSCTEHGRTINRSIIRRTSLRSCWSMSERYTWVFITET